MSNPAETCLDENLVAELVEGSLRPEVRAAVEEHVDACERCRALLTTLSEEADRHPPEGSTDGPGAPLAGSRLDHFTILRPLGRGGMGEVYLAKDERLDRRVALKLVRAEASGARAALASLEREARLTARLRHPNVVTIHAVGEHRGQPYVALEYVPGGTLAARMAEGRMPASQVVTVGRNVAEALDHCHAAGVVHRDLKPSNVLLERDGRARIADFGLATRFSPDPSWAETVSTDAMEERSSAVPPSAVSGGTPLYMAPERWASAAPSPAEDIWALGVILFEMLSGAHPFGPDLAVIVDPTLVAPAPRVPESIGAPAELVELVAKCLEIRPELRPSASELRRSLTLLDDGIAPTGPEPAIPPVGKSLHAIPRSAPGRRYGAATVVTGVLSAVALLMWRPWEAPVVASPQPGPLATEAASVSPLAPNLSPLVAAPIEGESCTFEIRGPNGVVKRFGGARYTLPDRNGSYVAAGSYGPQFNFYCAVKMSEHTNYTVQVTVPRTMLAPGSRPLVDEGPLVQVMLGAIPPEGLAGSSYVSSGAAAPPLAFGTLDLSAVPRAPGEWIAGTADAKLVGATPDDVAAVHVAFRFRI